MLRQSAALIVLVLLSVSVVGPAHAEEPGDVINKTTKQGAKLIEEATKEGTLNDTATQAELRKKLSSKLRSNVNFPMLTRATVGPEARNISRAKLDRLSDVFGEMVTRLYYDRLLEYVSGDQAWRFDSIETTNTEYRGDRYARVATELSVTNGEQSKTFTAKFKMINDEGRWTIYDISVAGVSLTENYRSQFSSILANHDVDHLIETLQDKLEGLKDKRG